MIASIKHNSRIYKIDLGNPIDISIPLTGKEDNVNAWYLGPPTITAHKQDGFIGSVEDGAPVNFNDIWFNPHSHVTHTECLGHITEAFHSVNQKLKKFFFLAELVTVAPEQMNGDFVISEKQLKYALGNKKRKAVVIRTLPNLSDKRTRQYSDSNPPYLLEEAAQYLVKKGVDHLLIDLPSVDKERDNGDLLAHKAFWNVNGKPREKATITEFIYVPNTAEDGTYFLDLQVAPMENDASPSRPILYKIED
ncbi:cyclase family protein [Flagellimonas zhangzhouensis]|uniref:Kynurenine formamidase n=1 Tax=Flagellimonas zhangzhouensis TaxID=1073328 RepID=A0A1H2WPK8_9FLAO|nr:cyclase family protein [Allomuricauda zhangzhouensis]SDQ23343.1 Kynurenine formamidase [Allomuricauda zhangzhouensis]SDW82457.1 Kynurenine formamidase [Allomuricauda zhangzhouensis]